MFKKATYIIGLFFLISCQNLKPAQKPDQLLTPVEMETILTDLIMLDAMISVNNFRIDNHEIDVPDFVYNKYEIDSLTLSKNIEYYNEQYKVNAEIYEKVKLNIEDIKKRLDEEKRIQDSIQKAELEVNKTRDSLAKIKP
jgi:hypothetical protein